jgi:hypothetical protein
MTLKSHDLKAREHLESGLQISDKDVVAETRRTGGFTQNPSDLAQGPCYVKDRNVSRSENAKGRKSNGESEKKNVRTHTMPLHCA